MTEQELRAVRLSEHFNLWELVRSDWIERDAKIRHEQMNPPPRVLEALEYLCVAALEPIRKRLDWPILVNSGWRCLALNRALPGGSKKTSQHVVGQAADIKVYRPEDFVRFKRTGNLRQELRDAVFADRQPNHRPPLPALSANWYLWASAALHLVELDIDQLVSEYGDNWWAPAWIHVSASEGGQRDRRLSRIGPDIAGGLYSHKSTLNGAVVAWELARVGHDASPV